MDEIDEGLEEEGDLDSKLPEDEKNADILDEEHESLEELAEDEEEEEEPFDDVNPL
ncbi:MAG: hypothetical protein WBL19_01885 [Minisyncoccia bacterium]